MKLTEKAALKHRIAIYERLKADKLTRYSHWQNLLDYTLPHKAALSTPFTTSSRPFKRKYDGIGMLNAQRFASRMYAELSPGGRNFFWLAAPAGTERGYAEHLGQRTERLHHALRTSNFATEIHNAYEDLTAGTCCIAVSDEPDEPFSLSTRPLSEYVFTCDRHGRPDTIYVEHSWTPYEAAERFGINKLPQELQRALEELKDSAFVDRGSYLNIVAPNKDFLPAALTAKGSRYTSVWIDRQKNELLETQGVRRLRHVIARFWKPSGLRWGMGPSDMAYSWIRCKDKAAEILLKYGAKAMDPASLWPDDGAFHPMTTNPGTLIRGRFGAMDRGTPQYLQLTADHRLGQWLFEYYDTLIAQAYLGQIFETLRQPGDKTAYEIATVLQKDYSLGIPVFARLRSELFEPLLRLCLELLTEYELGITNWRYGGQELPEYQYDLELITPLALAIKYTELQSYADLHTLVSPFASIDPDIWLNWKLDDIARAISENMGIPRRMMRSVTEREAIKEQIAQLRAEREALEQAKLAGEATSKLARRVEPESLLAGAAA